MFHKKIEIKLPIRERYPMTRILLRFYPSAEVHFTALLLSDHDIYQVKGSYGNGNHYASIGDWLQTLPGSPSADQLVTTVYEKVVRIPHAQHATRVAKPKKIKWNVPKRNDTTRSVPWARHLYYMIREANPEWLKREDIRDAYNAVVDILRKYSTQIRTNIPYRYSRYYSGIDIKEYRRFLHPGPNTPHHEFEAILKEIVEVYRVLYEMVGIDLLAYMDMASQRAYAQAKIKQYTKMMQQAIKKHQALMQQAIYHQQCIEQYQASINSLQSS